MFKMAEVYKVVDVEPFQAGDGDEFRFRLEILRLIDEKTFIGKIYRLETYRLQPTFPQSEGVLPDWKDDALVFVADETFDTSSLKGDSVQDVLTKFRMALAKTFESAT